MADPDVLTQVASRPALSATSDHPNASASPDPALSPPASADAPPAPVVPETAPSTGADAEPPVGDAGEPIVEAEPQPEPKKSTFGERLSELTRQRNEERARAQAAVEAATKLSERLEKALEVIERVNKPAETAPAAPTEAPRPKREEFADPDAYDAALIEWVDDRAARRAATEFEARQKAQRQADEAARAAADANRHTTQVIEQWQERRAKFAEQHPDFAEVAENDSVQISIPMAQLISTVENGPELAYHLGQHPEIADKIAGMVVPGQVFPPGHALAGRPVPDVQRQVYEMGKLAATLAVPAKPEVSRVPAPITPIGSNSNAGPKDPAEMTTEEYAALRMPQLRSERRAGMLGIPKPN